MVNSSGSLNAKTLVGVLKKISKTAVLTRNFIVKRHLAPHLAVLAIGVVVAVSNVIVAHGADQLYNMIPSDPGIQVSTAQSIDQYTPLISADGNSVEKLMTLSTDESSDGFAMTANKSVTEQIQREDPAEVAAAAAAAAAAAGPRTKTISYTVEGGDTLSGLGMKYNVKVTSIKFVNNITTDTIKPGQTIKIPPEGYVPTAREIAAQQAKTAKTTVGRTTSSSGSIVVNAAAGSKSNGYPYGYCTYYVATRRAVPVHWGNAGQWLSSAKSAGYSTGSEPAVGAIMVSRESWWGHVAYVESVNGSTITVSEMNYAGWGVTSRRTLSAYDGVIKGFIY